MAKVKSTDQKHFTAMDVPHDEELEIAAKAYRGAVTKRLKAAADEATKKSKVDELLHAWATREKIKPVIVDDEKKLIYRRDDVEVIATISLKESLKVNLGEEIKDEPVQGDDAPDEKAV